MCSPPPPPLHWQGYQHLPPGLMVLATPARCGAPSSSCSTLRPTPGPLGPACWQQGQQVFFFSFFFIAM